MKGVIFTQFIDYLESAHGYALVDKMLSRTKLANDGAYTSGGNYPHSDFESLVNIAAEILGLSPGELLEGYGYAMTSFFYKHYHAFFDQKSDVFDFLVSIDNHIHPEVLKLYTDVELPTFNKISRSDDELVIEYTSPRKMGDFACGLIKGSLDHYGVDAVMHKEKVKEDGTVVRFTIKR